MGLDYDGQITEGQESSCSCGLFTLNSHPPPVLHMNGGDLHMKGADLPTSHTLEASKAGSAS